ncbi:MAG: hypothetical protein H7Z14_02200, partial [Anaerolineae bacterium]|nr:hypothetical protein [Phycisphaerae bacterium]
MPIPTDTYWNIRRLNWVFAVSAIVLFAVTGWSILQDHTKTWRVNQQQGRVWEAALTDQRLEIEKTDKQREAQLAEIQKQIDAASAELGQKHDQITKLQKDINDLSSKRQTLEFGLNNAKASLAVTESNLQDATTAHNDALVKKLTADIAAPRKQVMQETEFLANEIVAPLEAKQAELRQLMAARTELEGKRTKLLTAQDSAMKKKESLQPSSIVGKLSEFVRNQPLLDFINPADKVQQIVLPDVQTDVAFMKITTLDRCTTCHVNIAKKEFRVERIVDYLQEESAKARNYKLPETPSAKAAGPAATEEKPGPVAMPDFWHAWALKVSPETIRKNVARINQITGIVGKGATITLDGKPLPAF